MYVASSKSSVVYAVRTSSLTPYLPREGRDGGLWCTVRRL
jgi:hypothetical protein